MEGTELGWSSAIPRSVVRDAVDIAADAFGGNPAERFDSAGQRSAFLHSVRVGAAMLHLAREQGLSREAEERMALKGVLHDVGKPEVPGISDKGVWTQERRQHVREQHTALGGLFVAEHMAHLPDADDIEFAVKQHHSHIPLDYHYRSPEEAAQWGEVHALQIFDRMDALATRPYVTERYGALTAEKLVELALAADEQSDIQALPSEIYVESKTIDLTPSLDEMVQRAITS